MLQEEALSVKEQLENPELEGVNVSKFWLEYFKKAYGIREYHISEEDQDVPLVTVKVWLKRLPNIVTDHEQCNQWKMDKRGLFFETLSNKGLVKKKESSRGGK